MKFDRQAILRAIKDPCFRGLPGEPVNYIVGGGLSATFGANPFVCVRPDKSVVLEINQIGWQGDNSGFGAAREWLQLLPGRVFDAFGGLGAGTTNQLLNFEGGNKSDSANSGGAKSRVIGNVTSTVPGGNVTVFRSFPLVNANNWNQGMLIPLVRPIILWGDDPGSPPVFGCFPQALNTSAGFFMIGREWPFDTESY